MTVLTGVTPGLMFGLDLPDAARILIGGGFGAIIGSFLATIVSRWPKGESVVRGRSRCDGCGRALKPYELVPLLGWLRSRGTCRSCGARIDPVHPIVEAGAALIGAIALLFWPPFPALVMATGGWLLLTLAVLDARHFWLPDALTLPLAALGLTLGDWVLPASFPDRAIGVVVGGGLFYLIALGYRRVRRQEGLGLGDAKLLGAIGGWLGWQMLPLVLLVAAGAALLWVLMLRLRGTVISAEMRVPLGTFLCLAVVPAWLLGSALGL